MYCVSLIIDSIYVIERKTKFTLIWRFYFRIRFRFNTQFDSTPSQHTLPGVELKVRHTLSQNYPVTLSPSPYLPPLTTNLLS